MGDVPGRLGRRGGHQGGGLAKVAVPVSGRQGVEALAGAGVGHGVDHALSVGGGRLQPGLLPEHHAVALAAVVGRAVAAGLVQQHGPAQFAQAVVPFHAGLVRPPAHLHPSAAEGQHLGHEGHAVQAAVRVQGGGDLGGAEDLDPFAGEEGVGGVALGHGGFHDGDLTLRAGLRAAAMTLRFSSARPRRARQGRVVRVEASRLVSARRAARSSIRSLAGSA